MVAGGSQTSEPNLTSTQGAGRQLPSIPAANHVQVVASLNSDHPSITISIPVDPTTRAVGLNVRPEGNHDENDGPVLQQLVLVDQDGSAVARLGPVLEPQSDVPADAVTVALDNAPAGGLLLVQVSVLSTSDGSSTTATGLTIPGWELPFVLDVQRQDEIVQASMVVTPGADQGEMGTLPSSSPAGQTAPATPAPDSPVSTIETGDPQGADRSQPIPAGEQSTGAIAELSGSYGVNVATGPLASRSAAPLGPALATLLADPAPPVDRHQQVLSPAIDSLESEEGGSASARRSELARLESVPTPPQAGTAAVNGARRVEGPLVAVAGLGAFPLKVTAAGGEAGRVDLASLLGTLPQSLTPKEIPALAADSDRSMEDVWEFGALSAARSSSGEERAALDDLTAACGLALVVGLSSGPLFPDLLAFLPSRSNRWRRALPGSMPAGPAPAATRSRARGIGPWLRTPWHFGTRAEIG
jgi:hypothetical protein